MKIFASVGSTGFKFDRFFKILDELCAEGFINGNDLIAQTGKTDYAIKNYEHFDFAPYERVNELIGDADIIICHSGTGTVIGSLKKGKKVIVFPRRKKYNEHESDHQLDLAGAFESDGYVLVAKDKEELKNAILGIDSFSPKTFVSNNSNFIELIKGLL